MEQTHHHDPKYSVLAPWVETHMLIEGSLKVLSLNNLMPHRGYKSSQNVSSFDHTHRQVNIYNPYSHEESPFGACVSELTH